MFCTKCGKKIKDTARFCPYCGNAVEPEDWEGEEDLDELEDWDGEEDLDELEGWDEEEEWNERSQWRERAQYNRTGRKGRALKNRRKRLHRLKIPALTLVLAAAAAAGAFLVYNHLKPGVSEKTESGVTETNEAYLNEEGVSDADKEQSDAVETEDNLNADSALAGGDSTALAAENETKTDENTTENTSVSSAPDNLEAQIQLLAGLGGSLAGQDPFSYATYLSCWVTDYDKNGRVELNLSVTEGSGIFTSWRCYEVNEAFDGVTDVVWAYDTYAPDSFTDLLPGDEESGEQQTEPGYYDAGSGTWYYIMSDVVRAGWAQNGTSYYTMAKKGSSLELVELGWLQNDNSEDGTTTTTYTVGETACGTEEEFYGAMRAKMDGLQELSYTVREFDILGSTDYYTDLWNSAAAFFAIS